MAERRALLTLDTDFGSIVRYPPLGDVDRDKYLAIGESDRMTLKFLKVADGAAR